MPHKDPEAARAWRRDWWHRSPDMREKQNARSRAMKAKINAMLREHKLAVGCADCGFDGHHAALEFHHVGDDKEINISFAKSEAQARREMAKCEVLCSNCHRIRHWEMRYPCKPDIFADSYEPADAPASPRQEREALIEAMLWAYEGANRALMGPVGDARGARAGMEAALDAILASGFMVPASAAEEREALEKEIAAALFAETFGGTSDPDLTDLALGLAETQARAVADRLTTAGYVTPSAHAAALRERWEAGRDEAVNWLRLVASIVDHDLGHERASVYISVANEIAAFTPPEDSK